MNSIDSTHIQVTVTCDQCGHQWDVEDYAVTCDQCGHQWDVEDYDSMSVSDAEEKAKAEACPQCGRPRQVRFYNIKWDTTDDEHPDGQDVDLPDDVTLEVGSDVDLDTEGADVLSDQYGWCVFSFDYEAQP